MSDLLGRKVTAQMKRQLRDRARMHQRRISEEAKCMHKEAQWNLQENRKIGTELFNLIRREHRGDDLVFEHPGTARQPPDFE
jgi:hypothetical protein